MQQMPQAACVFHNVWRCRTRILAVFAVGFGSSCFLRMTRRRLCLQVTKEGGTFAAFQDAGLCCRRTHMHADAHTYCTQTHTHSDWRLGRNLLTWPTEPLATLQWTVSSFILLSSRCISIFCPIHRFCSFVHLSTYRQCPAMPLLW